MNRRNFLARSCAWGVSPFVNSQARAQLIAPPASDKKVAAVVTIYARFSHADIIVTRSLAKLWKEPLAGLLELLANGSRPRAKQKRAGQVRVRI
jgi:hypothetical protein